MHVPVICGITRFSVQHDARRIDESAALGMRYRKRAETKTILRKLDRALSLSRVAGGHRRAH